MAIEVLSRHQGRLHLNSLNDTAADTFAQYEEMLYLEKLIRSQDHKTVNELSSYIKNLSSLRNTTAEVLARSKEDLHFDSLTSLSYAVAVALAKHEGKLFFADLPSVSDEAAEALAQP